MLRKLSLIICFSFLTIASNASAAAEDRITWPADDAFLQAAREAAGVPAMPAAQPSVDIGSPPGVFLSEPDNRTLRVIRHAEQMRNEGRWADAIAAYQVLINDEIQSDFPAAQEMYIPAAEFARRRLLSLPDGVFIYRNLYNTDAARLHAEALRQRDPDLLSAVAERYPLASIAPVALNDAADILLINGRFAEALRVYRRALAYIRVGDELTFSPVMLLVKTAAAHRALGAAEQAAAILEFVFDAANELEAGREVEAARIAGIVEALSEMPAQEPAAPCWGTFGGGNAHSCLPERVILPGRLRWHADKPEEGVQTQQRPSAPRRQPEMICHPAVVGGVLYHRTETNVTASDLLSGKTLWSYREPMVNHAGRPLALAGRMGGSLFITADENRVYVNLHYISRDMRQQLTRLKLMAFNTSPEGPRIAWERGGDNEQDEALENLSFTSPPIISGDRLFVGAIQVPAGDEMYLLTLDAGTGRLLHKTFICIGRTNIRYDYRSGNGIAELAAEKDGIVYIVTNLGIVAAVDGNSGRVLWKSSYNLPEQQQPTGYAANFFRPGNPPVISDGRLFVLPADGTHLSVYDLDTGLVLWRYPVGLDYAYLLGVKDGRAIISGNRLLSISIDGKEQWVSAPLPGEPFGRGIVAEDFILCPVTGGVEMIHLETGRFAGMSRPYASWQSWLTLQRHLEGVVQSGHLLIADGKLVITGTDRIQVYDERGNLHEILAKLAETPGDPDLHSELASYYLWQGQYADAAREFETALANLIDQQLDDRRAEIVRGELFTIYMNLGDTAFAAGDHEEALQHFRSAFRRAPSNETRIHASVKASNALAGLGDYATAIDILQRLVTDYPNVQFQPDGYLSVQTRAYAEAAISDLLNTHGRQYYSRYDTEAAQLLHSDKPEEAAALEVFRRYPNSVHITPALLSLAKAQMVNEDYTTAGEYLALLLRRRPDDAQAQEAAKLLEFCLEKQGIAAPRDSGVNILPPLEQQWTLKTDGGSNVAEIHSLPATGDEDGELFYVVLGKNLYAHRLSDGKLAWRNSAGWLGIQLGDLPQRAGTQIVDVMPGTPAVKAEFMPNDIIVEFDGVPVTDTQDLIRVCGNTPADRTVEVKVLRNEEPLTLTATLHERPAQHDQMNRGYKVYIVGTAPAAGKDGERRQGLVISRDRCVQVLNPQTGETMLQFPVTPQRMGGWPVAEPLQNDGLALADADRIAAVTQEWTGLRVQIQVQGVVQAPAGGDTPAEIALWNFSGAREREPVPQVWSRVLDTKPVSDPFITGNSVALVEQDNENRLFIGCYSITTGEPVRRIGPLGAYGAPSEIIRLSGGRAAIAIGGDALCFQMQGDNDDAGKTVWTRHIGAANLNVFKLLPATHRHGRELLLTATADLGVQVIEAATGESLWSLAPRSGFTLQKTIADDERIFVASRAANEPVARIDVYSIENGRTLWEHTVPELQFATDMLATDSYVVAAFSETDPNRSVLGAAKVIILNKNTGETVQEITFEKTTVHRLKVVNGVLLVVTQNSVIGFAPRTPRT